MQRRSFLAVPMLAGLAPTLSRAAGSELIEEFMDSQDLQQWHEERVKITLAVGDRIFSRPFERVFDSLTVAIASVGARVENMERQSGYIAASIPDLGPEKSKSLSRDAMREFAAAKGFSPLVADAPWAASIMRGMGGLTASLARQSKTQTKVKLRFEGVPYPRMVTEYYQLVWAELDKQMFLDQSLD